MIQIASKEGWGIGMRISGRTLGEHIQLLAPLFGVIAAVWLLRLVFGALQAPSFLIYASSLTVVVPVCILLAALLIHAKDFAGYASVVAATVMLAAWGQLLIVGAILFSVLTGIENIYTAPEFSIPGDDPNHSRHMIGHLTFGIGFESLSGSLMACILFFMLRRVRALLEK
jgi:hypothetical protein